MEGEPIAISAQQSRDVLAALQLAKDTLDTAMADLAIAWPIAQAALRMAHGAAHPRHLVELLAALTPEQRDRLRGPGAAA